MKFNIPIFDKSKQENEIKTVEGQIVFSMYGFDWVLHKMYDNKNKLQVISEYHTGCNIPRWHTNKQSIISIVKKFLKDKGQNAVWNEVKLAAERNTQLFGEPFLNEPVEELV